MPRKGHNEEQIVFALKEVENGAKVAPVCRKLGIAEQTFTAGNGNTRASGSPSCGNSASFGRRTPS
jgi:hypothetical protein